ncbi:polysaccharide pyruvyl transferase family protein [Nesterenkonia muleiensis]|uniref:polysaccharide pyruvyl transferase family protein n=1 Tax=Nesterenkonia muleiensis TaxID=2282648 RepID=UPI0013003245|nr:polysaccharide pyruvyl transferase family protein [Nesterenkonia muleiensis]
MDRAAEDFLSARGADYTLFSAQQAEGRMYNHVPFQRWEDLDSYSHVVYWGDFLNNPFYGYKSFPNRSRRWGIETSKREAIATWKELFTPRYVEQKLYAIGQNFQHDFTEKVTDFGPVFRRLEKTLEALVVRDPFSFQNLSRMVEFSALNQVQQGLDCAFLQEPRHRKTNGGDGTFAYFFRRSKLANGETLVRRVEEATGLRGVELKNWIPLPRSKWEGTFKALKIRIDSASLVVTDTYHVGVNAMQSRTPVVGIGRQSTRQVGTIGDFKKRVLFDMFDLSRFYHEIPADQEDTQAYGQVVRMTERALSEHGDPSAAPYALVEARTRQFTGQVERLLELR